MFNMKASERPHGAKMFLISLSDFKVTMVGMFTELNKEMQMCSNGERKLWKKKIINHNAGEH